MHTRLLRDATRCTLDDLDCLQSAKDEGKEVIFVDDDGEVITDDEGVPITDRDEAAKRAGTSGVPGANSPRPGDGTWANYDFVPAETVLVYEDFAGENIGDFPRLFDLIQGNWDVIQWQGGRYVRTPLFIAVGSASADYPILIGSLRIAGGGADLYDRLARDGRVATQGILFDVASDVIRAESTPTLKEIGAMLQEHPDLRISIEGRTDSDDDDAFNQDLSERRAASVKAYLVEAYEIDLSRLESKGFGEPKRVAFNDTPEGSSRTGASSW